MSILVSTYIFVDENHEIYELCLFLLVFDFQGGKDIADARLIMRNVPFPNPALEQHVRGEGERLGLLLGSHT